MPLLERVKFLAIVSSNLDEFFMVRVAGLKRLVGAGDADSAGPDGLGPAETLSAVSLRAHELSEQQHRCWIDELEPALAREGISVVRPEDATSEQRKHLEHFVRRTLLPVLTPLAIDPGHPVSVPRESDALPRRADSRHVAVAPASDAARRRPPAEPGRAALRAPAERAAEARFMRLEDVVRLYLPWLYHGYEIDSCHAIRVTRDAEIAPQNAEAEDTLAAVESSLRERRMGAAVRLQYDADLPADVLETLVDAARARRRATSTRARGSPRSRTSSSSMARSMSRA